MPSFTNKISADFAISSRAEKSVRGQHFNIPQYYSYLVFFLSFFLFFSFLFFFFFFFFCYWLLPTINSYCHWQINFQHIHLSRLGIKNPNLTWHRVIYQILFFVGCRGRSAETSTGGQRQAGEEAGEGCLLQVHVHGATGNILIYPKGHM